MEVISCLQCPYRQCEAGMAQRSPRPDQEELPLPKDVSVYRLSESSSGALVSCRTTVVIAGQEIDAIIDTGAARTILTSVWYEKLAHVLPSLKPCRARLRGAGGEPCDVRGELDLQFFIEGVPYFHSVIVSLMPCVEMLLGIDFLYRQGALIDCQYGRLIIRHQSIVIRSYPHRIPFSCRSLESRSVAPGSEVLLVCYVEDPVLRNKDVMFEVCAVLGEGVVALPGLMTCDERGWLRLPVRNTGQFEVDVAQGQTIGIASLESFEELEMYSMAEFPAEGSENRGEQVWVKLPGSPVVRDGDGGCVDPATPASQGVSRLFCADCVSGCTLGDEVLARRRLNALSLGTSRQVKPGPGCRP